MQILTEFHKDVLVVWESSVKVVFSENKNTLFIFDISRVGHCKQRNNSNKQELHLATNFWKTCELCTRCLKSERFLVFNVAKGKRPTTHARKWGRFSLVFAADWLKSIPGWIYPEIHWNMWKEARLLHIKLHFILIISTSDNNTTGHR